MEIYLRQECFFADSFQCCFLEKEGTFGGEKCFVYFSLPLRMFCSLLQNTDNQNVLEGERESGEGMKTRIDLAHMLCRSAMSSRART